MILAYTIWIIRIILWFAGFWYLPTILLLNLARFHRVARGTNTFGYLTTIGPIL
jgi:uncharacterized membrane protein